MHRSLFRSVAIGCGAGLRQIADPMSDSGHIEAALKGALTTEGSGNHRNLWTRRAREGGNRATSAEASAQMRSASLAGRSSWFRKSVSSRDHPSTLVAAPAGEGSLDEAIWASSPPYMPACRRLLGLLEALIVRSGWFIRRGTGGVQACGSIRHGQQKQAHSWARRAYSSCHQVANAVQRRF